MLFDFDFDLDLDLDHVLMLTFGCFARTPCMTVKHALSPVPGTHRPVLVVVVLKAYFVLLDRCVWPFLL